MDVVPTKDLDDAGVAGALAVQQRVERQLDAHMPVIEEEEFRSYLDDDRTDGNRHERFAVLDGDTVVALAHLELEQGDDNPHLASSEIFGAAARPDAGRAAVDVMLDVAEEDNRTSLMGWGPNDPAEGEFWTGVGGVHRYNERISSLDLRSVDADLMRRWIDARQERAADVELVRWTERCPDEVIDAYAVSMSAMSDAPKGDLSLNDWTVSPDDVREDESARAAVGSRIHVIFAVTPDGEPAGHTAIHENLHRPEASWQWDTVVLDAHRRRGIGRWLKAEMWQQLRDTAPHINQLRTGNASNNDAMLSINVAMGFRPVHEFGAWEAPLDAYRRALRPAPRSSG